MTFLLKNCRVLKWQKSCTVLCRTYVLERIKVASCFFGCILSVGERLFPVLFVTEEFKLTKHSLEPIPALKMQACGAIRCFSNHRWFFELVVERVFSGSFWHGLLAVVMVENAQGAQHCLCSDIC